VAAGCRALVSELSSRDGAAVLVLGEGPWSRVADAQSDGGASYPILAAARRRADGTPFSIDRVLDVAVDHFIDDHRLDGRPVLPMTVALEMMTELAAAGWPEMVVTDVRNVAVLKGIVFTESDHLRHAVRLEAPAVDGSASGVTVHVNMRSGANAEQLHYRATFELKPSAPAPARHQAADVRREFPLSVQDAYRQYLFHGPRFAHIAQIDGLSERGLLARIRPSEPGSCITGATGDWLIDPVALDSALQMVILWARAVHDVTPLPARFKRYRRYGGLRSREGALMRCELVASADAQAHLVTADLTFFEEDGTVIGVLEGLECTASRELNRLAGAGEALGVPVR